MKLWTSLLFLHGHIADPALARSLAADAFSDAASGPAPAQPGHPASQQPCTPSKRGAIAAATCPVALSPLR